MNDSTVTLTNVEIFATGTHNGHTFSDRDLEDIVENTNHNLHEIRPFGKIGHEEDQALVTASQLPNVGTIQNLRKVGSKLVADFVNVPIAFARIIGKGGYRRVSSELVLNWTNSVGKTFNRILKAVAFLGQDWPAVRTLDDVESLYQSHLSNYPTQTITLAFNQETTIMNQQNSTAMPPLIQFHSGDAVNQPAIPVGDVLNTHAPQQTHAAPPAQQTHAAPPAQQTHAAPPAQQTHTAPSPSVVGVSLDNPTTPPVPPGPPSPPVPPGPPSPPVPPGPPSPPVPMAYAAQQTHAAPPPAQQTHAAPPAQYSQFSLEGRELQRIQNLEIEMSQLRKENDTLRTTQKVNQVRSDAERFVTHGAVLPREKESFIAFLDLLNASTQVVTLKMSDGTEQQQSVYEYGKAVLWDLLMHPNRKIKFGELASSITPKDEAEDSDFYKGFAAQHGLDLIDQNGNPAQPTSNQVGGQ